jgi:hypothetical protein
MLSAGDDPYAKAQPRAAKSSRQKPEIAFCSGVSWSVVMVSTDGRETSGAPPRRSISAKARQSAAVETSPAPPDGNAGGALHCPLGSS